MNTKKMTDEQKEQLFQVVDELYKKTQEELYEETQGGIIRMKRGKLIETIIDKVIEAFKEWGQDVECRVGSQDIQLIEVGKFTKKHQVDRHIYVQGKLKCIIECKSYLDLCFYERACHDFKTMRIKHPDVIGMVFTLENSLNDESRVFTDTVFDSVCKEIFYMCEGKRSSSKPIYKKKHEKLIQKDKFLHFVEELFSITQSP
jgi:hypothetical protein